MSPGFLYIVVALQDFLGALPRGNEGNTKWPSLYIDYEGNNLSRKGTFSLLTILIESRKTFHIVDVTALGSEAFVSAGADGRTLKSILESDTIIKTFFDIRNDSHALFSLYGVRVAGIEDLQLMELASRQSSKRLVHSLAKCVENDDKIDFQEKQHWKEIKDSGRPLFNLESGGSYINARSLRRSNSTAPKTSSPCQDCVKNTSQSCVILSG